MREEKRKEKKRILNSREEQRKEKNLRHKEKEEEIFFFPNLFTFGKIKEESLEKIYIFAKICASMHLVSHRVCFEQILDTYIEPRSLNNNFRVVLVNKILVVTYYK